MSDHREPGQVSPITSLVSAQPIQAAAHAPCQMGCATGADVRGWIALAAQAARRGVGADTALRDAWLKIVDVNPFPATLGRVCPHPCEASCTRSTKDGAVAVNALEQYLGDWAIANDLALPAVTEEPTGFSVGVVGAGPAGLSCAYQLARRGHRVTVYDRAASAGGMLRMGIPDFRLPPEIVDAEVARIEDLGVSFAFGTEISSGEDLTELREGHDAVFLATGAPVGRSLGIPGEDLRGVHLGIDYLAMVNHGQDVDLGPKVAVIGGGNTAMDAARTALRRDSTVTILYRRTRREMPASPDEIEEALAEGVELEPLVAPVEIRGSDGRVEAIRVVEMELGPADASGRPRPEPVSGSERDIPVDAVIAAIAQRPDAAFLPDVTGPVAPGEIAPQLWVGGDLVDTAIAGIAIRHGWEIAERIHTRLLGIPAAPDATWSPVDGGKVKLEHLAASSRVSTRKRYDPDDPDAEVHEPLDHAAFVKEAERCFSCGLCHGCSQCFMYCTVGAFRRTDGGPGNYFEIDLTDCTSCAKCIEVCPCGYLREAPAGASTGSALHLP